MLGLLDWLSSSNIALKDHYHNLVGEHNYHLAFEDVSFFERPFGGQVIPAVNQVYADNKLDGHQKTVVVCTWLLLNTLREQSLEVR